MSATEEAIKIAVLEQRLSEVTSNISKLNDAIEKIGEANTNLIKMLAVHEEKIEQGDKNDAIIVKMVQEVENSLRNENKRIEEHVNKSDEKSKELENRLDDVVRVKWITVGVGSVLVVLTGLLSPIASSWADKNLIDNHTQQVYEKTP